MEYIPFGTLRTLISRHQQNNDSVLSSTTSASDVIGQHINSPLLTLAEKHVIALDIAEAMDYFHSAPMMQDNRGALHQNLKSSNIMLTIENGSLRAKVSDFGLTGKQSQKESLYFYHLFLITNVFYSSCRRTVESIYSRS
jgi:serine/threonine protein kinase